MPFADLELPELDELPGFGGYADLGFGQGDAIALRTEELGPGSMGAFDEDQEYEEAEHDRIGLGCHFLLFLVTCSTVSWVCGRSPLRVARNGCGRLATCRSAWNGHKNWL